MEIFRHILLYRIDPLFIVALLALMLAFSKVPRLRGPVIFLNVIISLRYIIWRGFFTLNTADYLAILISGAVLGAELYGFLQSLLFYYQSAPVVKRVPTPGGESFRPAVDIFVTVYTEPKEILERTLVGCKAQDWPVERLNVYVLDDGGREEIKRLSESLGCGYITRATRKDAKAGNLNHALKQTGGEFVAIFDCDHVPVRSFLKETIGFFADPRAAIVQTPHHFYNPDTFQRNLRLEKEITNEQDLFFHIIQPGRDRMNSAFFAGSCGVFRRKALDEIGGIITRTITEDLHTSMALHARGYKSVYVNSDLSVGLSPESASGYLRQRERWAKGGIQVFVLDNPLIKRGLSFHQRLNYFASTIYFFNGLPRLVYLAAPLAYLLFKYPPLMTDVRTLLGYYLPHYLATIIAFNMVSRGHRNPFWSDVYETLMSFVLTLAAIKTVLMPFGHTFKVTPKGERRGEWSLQTSLVLPHILLAVLLLIGIEMGILSLGHKGSHDSVIISLVWAFYNLVLLVTAVIAARERPQRRTNTRLARSIRCELYSSADRSGGMIPCVTTDLSETGVSIRLPRHVEFATPFISLDLISGYGEVSSLKGRVVRNEMDRKGDFVLGINFIDMDAELTHGVIRQMFSPEESWKGYHKEIVTIKLWRFITQLYRSFRVQFIRDEIYRRIAPRFAVARVCELSAPEGAFKARVRDVSMMGISIEIASPAVTAPVTVVVRKKDGPPMEARGEVVWQVEKKRKRLIGIRFLDAEQGKAVYREMKPL